VPLAPNHARDPAVVGPLGSLLLSVVNVQAPMLLVRAIRWYRDLARLGVHLPFCMVHDIGHLYATPNEQYVFGPRTECAAALASSNAHTAVHGQYTAILAELAASELCARARAMRLTDGLVVVLLARLLGPLPKRMRTVASYPPSPPMDPELGHELDPQLPQLYGAIARNFEHAALEVFVQMRLHVLTLADALDLDTLRLLGMLGPESSAASALDNVDLLAAMSSPAANDIVNFSLELLPSILETHRTQAAGTHAVHGYAGLGTKGSLDSMVLTELAWDELEFARRMIENETLYYTREQAPDEAKRLHYVVIDASASMRGDRQVFARGLAIALAKKLQLQGEEVWLRFFDSRLYEVQKPRPGQLPIAYLLGFKGERGRNPARVFAQLATELALVRLRDARDPVVHMLTHAALHVPRSLVTEVARLAHLFGVFILPSGGTLDLDYLDLLEGHAVVDNDTLSEQKARTSAATRIVADVADANRKPSVTKSDTGPVSLRGSAQPLGARPAP
jgi:hypothetical protein